MDPYNPYSPPASRESAPASRPVKKRAGRLWIKWAYLSICSVSFVVSLASTELAPYVGGQVMALIIYACFFGWLTLACTWIYAAWSEIPRQTRGWIEPSDAVWKLFYPFYNLYWMFFVSGALCDVLNARLSRLRVDPIAPKNMSIVGCWIHLAGNLARMPGLVGIGPFIAIIGHGVWFNYMLECDRARGILAEHGVED
jgi:hypothetical protein